MPCDANNVKWACTPCIKGHRTFECNHQFSRPPAVMCRTKTPGRPSKVAVTAQPSPTDQQQPTLPWSELYCSDCHQAWRPIVNEQVHGPACLGAWCKTCKAPYDRRRGPEGHLASCAGKPAPKLTKAGQPRKQGVPGSKAAPAAAAVAAAEAVAAAIAAAPAAIDQGQEAVPEAAPALEQAEEAGDFEAAMAAFNQQMQVQAPAMYMQGLNPAPYPEAAPAYEQVAPANYMQAQLAFPVAAPEIVEPLNGQPLPYQQFVAPWPAAAPVPAAVDENAFLPQLDEEFVRSGQAQLLANFGREMPPARRQLPALTDEDFEQIVEGAMAPITGEQFLQLAGQEPFPLGGMGEMGGDMPLVNGVEAFAPLIDQNFLQGAGPEVPLAGNGGFMPQVNGGFQPQVNGGVEPFGNGAAAAPQVHGEFLPLGNEQFLLTGAAIPAPQQANGGFLPPQNGQYQYQYQPMEPRVLHPIQDAAPLPTAEWGNGIPARPAPAFQPGQQGPFPGFHNPNYQM